MKAGRSIQCEGIVSTDGRAPRLISDEIGPPAELRPDIENSMDAMLLEKGGALTHPTRRDGGGEGMTAGYSGTPLRKKLGIEPPLDLLVIVLLEPPEPKMNHARMRNIPRRAPRALLPIVAVIALLASTATAETAPPPELEPCGPASARTEMLCGTISVPENPQRPDDRQISLSVIVIPALEGHRTGGGALFLLEGGPGVAASVRQGFFLGPGREYRRGRDLVLLNQRGSGDGPPALRCEALETRGPLDDLFPLPAVSACRAELEKHADLTQYGTWNAAADIELVRLALGYDQIDLLTLSYGTKLAQIYMKRFPESVRSAVLIGTAPPDFRAPLFHAANAQRALDLLFYACQSDEPCRTAYPDLREDWHRLLARLDARPVRVTLAGSAPARRNTIEIRRGELGEAVRNLMGSAAGQRRLPWIIHRAAAGDFGTLLGALPSGRAPYAAGLYLSIECTEGTARIDPADVAPATGGTFLGDYRVRAQLAACAAWPRASLPDGFFTPATAEIPVLMLSGDADHVAPPEWAAEVCAALPRCRLLRIPHLGHEFFATPGWTGGECPHHLARLFYASGDPKGVNASCLAKMVPPPFAVGR
jgi:pimeloyl-ACP methyl ester carboxylesterase